MYNRLFWPSISYRFGRDPSDHAPAPFPPVGGAWVVLLEHVKLLGPAADTELSALAFSCILALVV